jgi:hypothetical protein
VRRFDRGLFYIRLLDRETGDVQTVAVGIDPGSKKEALTVKSASHTYLNIQADAVTWVSKAVTTRRQMRRARRFRHCPYRKPRWANRTKAKLPPSTKARWQWKLRLCRWLARYYPIERFVVEDIKAITKGQRRWDASFSPLEVGKQWFYAELSRIAPIETKQGWETKELREAMELKKSSDKMSDKFSAHCIDSWVLSNWWTGGHTRPDSTTMLLITPLRFHRRQLHRFQPGQGSRRSPYGGTRSLGFKRGSWVKHPKYGVCYVGGTQKGGLSLHRFWDGKRLCLNAKVESCQVLTLASWRIRKETALSSPH